MNIRGVRTLRKYNFRVTYTQYLIYEGYVNSGSKILGLRILKNEYMRGTYTPEVEI